MSTAMEQVKNVITLLNESDKSSMKCFVYSSLMSGIKGQEILIDIAIHCLTFVDFVDFDFKGLYFDVLNLIFQRGELELGQVGIFEKASMRHGSSYVNAKKKLAVKYQFLLYFSLKYCLDKLARKSVDFYKRDFIALNIGIAYFKIPEFKERFMNAMMKENLVKIPEWKNFHWNLEDNQEEKTSTIDHFFNWQEYFYDQIPESEQKGKNLQILSVIACMKKWEDKISKRGVAMFLVIAKWAEYVRTTVVKKNIAWNNIPGYGSILRVIFSEMKERELSHYPDSLIEAAAQLSANESIIPVFIEIIFKKTNIHVPKDVEICMDLTVKLLSTLNKKGSVFPSNFDFSFFYKGLDYLIDYQHSISTPKALWMIYKTYHIFPLHEQYVIAKKLLSEKVTSCFYTWSWNIRDVFINIFFYQFNRCFSSKGEEFMVEEEKDFDNKKTFPKIKGLDLEKQLMEQMGLKSFTARNSFTEEPSMTKEISAPNSQDFHPGMLDMEELNKGSETVGRGNTLKSFQSK